MFFPPQIESPKIFSKRSIRTNGMRFLPGVDFEYVLTKTLKSTKLKGVKTKLCSIFRRSTQERQKHKYLFINMIISVLELYVQTTLVYTLPRSFLITNRNLYPHL